MATPARSRSSRILPALAGALGAGAAALWLVVDDACALDRAIAAGGGVPADRGTLILIGTLAAGALAWAIAYLVWGPGGWRVRRAAGASRRPLTYADLGPPPPRERPLPVDLDQPLSAYDPDALRPGVKRPT